MGNNVVHLWNRKGFYYYAYIYLYKEGKYFGTITKELDFITYHILRFLHGEQKMIEMASESAYLSKEEDF